MGLFHDSDSEEHHDEVPLSHQILAAAAAYEVKSGHSLIDNKAMKSYIQNERTHGGKTVSHATVKKLLAAFAVTSIF